MPPSRWHGLGRSLGQTHPAGADLPCRSQSLPQPSGPLIRTYCLKNQYLTLRACQAEGKALLVNICLSWQSQASTPLQLPRLAPGPWLQQLLANHSRDAPGELDIWQPAGQPCDPTPTIGLHTRPPGGRLSVPGAVAETTGYEISLDPKQAAFPRGAAGVSVYLGESKSRRQTLAVCL